MTTPEVKVADDKCDINLNFYFFLKHLVKSKLTARQVSDSLDICLNNGKEEWQITVNNILKQINEQIRAIGKKIHYKEIVSRIHNQNDLELFYFSLFLYSLKDSMLEKAKEKMVAVNKIQEVARSSLHPLSLEYDKLSMIGVYSGRVYGALLALVISEKGKEIELVKRLTTQGIELNQIVMLMFSEIMDQSIISNSGSDYEDRILSVLVSKMGLGKEEVHRQVHDKTDPIIEYDFLFKLQNGRRYGIGAKRTLRERYKQFQKTPRANDIDVMIVITLGLDLTKNMATNIRELGMYIFVADEVYDNAHYLQKQAGIFPTRDLTETTLLTLE